MRPGPGLVKGAGRRRLCGLEPSKPLRCRQIATPFSGNRDSLSSFLRCACLPAERMTASTLKALRPRILYVTPVWPRGKAFGGQLRALHIGRALKQMGDVKLVVVSSDATDPEVARQT